MTKRTHIVIAEPSEIIRSGLIAILQRATNLAIDIAEVANIASVGEKIKALSPDIVIINPAHLGVFSASQLREGCAHLRVVALQSTLADEGMLKSYDENISIYDSAESICNTLAKVINSDDEPENRTELSQREKEIVVCIAKGMSNKEIADELFLSTHTVISHRRNITNKLEIYSASGLTIYAIVNKLIDIESLPAK